MNWLNGFDQLTLNNREWAALFWIIVAILLLFSQRNLRASVWELLRSAFRPLFLVPVAGMLTYIIMEVWIAQKLSLWQPALLKNTILWMITSGLVLFFSFDKASEEQFFRRAIRGAVGATVFLEFFLNVVVFSLVWELLMQPAITFLVLLTFIAERDEGHRKVKNAIDSLLAVIGFVLFALTARALYASWYEIDKHLLILELLLPVWLTAGFLPCAYLFSLFVHYDSAFRGIDHAAADWRVRLCTKLALISKLHLKAGELRAFDLYWARRITAASGFIAARRVVDDFHQEKRDARRAESNERARLKRYAGSSESDEEGRRLDRRQFKETMAALRYLSTCQMGWYRNRGGHYHDDLLDRFGDDFTRQGLPRDSGIEMVVARDGQAWYAWRRTISGWCFAIGAAGPPPDEWLYDGPEPPQDVPGKDLRWGESPFSDNASRNWTL